MSRKRNRQPTHPGRVFKADVLDELSLSITAAAHHLGVSRARLSTFVRGRTRCSTDMAQRIARATNTSMQSWLTMQIALDVWQAEQNPPEDIRAIEPF
ncbi:HigA family addiction module antidote protein [Proteobacteria bacterium 005FR1]|nr:HigA family addiction module antidote protein [Proteobacteria bacterium 005FR1]